MRLLVILKCFILGFCLQLVDCELKQDDNKRGLRHQLKDQSYPTIRGRSRTLEDLNLDIDDVVCENIFYVVVENYERDLASQDENEWVCDIDEGDGSLLAYKIKNIPEATLDVLLKNIDSFSGNAQMILRKAQQYLDSVNFLINIPVGANEATVEIEIIQFEESNEQPSFPMIEDTLVLRVTGSEAGEELSVDAATLSRRVFGGADDFVNLKEQYAACSANKLIIVKASGYDQIVDGVLEVKIDVSTSAEASKPLIGGTNEYLENVIIDAGKAILGVTEDLGRLFSLVMICLPEGSNVRNAYARIGGKRSVFSGNWCLWPSTQMHEVGHSFRLRHSDHNGVEYEDQSGIMGFSYPEDHEYPRMCFNGVKSWLFGWYEDKNMALDLDPTAQGQRSWSYKLVGVNDYVKATRGEHVVVIELKGIISNDPDDLDDNGDPLETNYYFLYNLQEGVNSETQEFQNRVTVTKGRLKTVNNALREAKTSRHVSALTVGNQFQVPDYKGSGINLMIKICEIQPGSPSYARIDFYFITEDDPCPSGPDDSPPEPGPDPTSEPTGAAGCAGFVGGVFSILDILSVFVTITFIPEPLRELANRMLFT